MSFSKQFYFSLSFILLIIFTGNFLLNIGPKGDGSILPYEANVLLGVGKWLDTHKNAIFETGLNPFLKLDWGQVSTGNQSLYLHVHQWPDNNKLVLPGLVNMVQYVTSLAEVKSKIKVERLNDDVVIDLTSVSRDPYLTILELGYDGELKVIPRHSSINQKGIVTLAGKEASKHGKFGKESYRSMLKDFYRSWYVDVPEAGRYQVKINFKMRYKEKDFILANATDELLFRLKGKGEKVAAVQAFDGNEIDIKATKSTGDFIESTIGEIAFSKAGMQKVILKQGQPFDLTASTKVFKAQDMRYRAMNIEIKSIELYMKK